MTIKMLVFDYRDSEKNFFGTHELENFEISFCKFSSDKKCHKSF